MGNRLQLSKEGGQVMKGYDFRTALAKIAPNYSIDKDNEGQLIIYTNMKETANDTYKEMTKWLSRSRFTVQAG